MNMPVKVLVVDDSAFMRRMLTNMLEKDRGIKVVGFARNGEEALDKISRLRPHVVTLDVEMPGMGGMETLKNIMKTHPLPVLMVSSVTLDGAEATIRALELGAVDFVTKPSRPEDMEIMSRELPQKVKIAAGIKLRKLHDSFQVKKFTKKEILPPKFPEVRQATKIVAIGTSTGGPSALFKVITSLPAGFPAGIIIVQHMPVGFTGPLADRINRNSKIEVKEAEEGDVVSPGLALIAPAGKQLKLKLRHGKGKVFLDDKAPFETLFKPSVDVTFLTVAETFGSQSLGVILTGMGNDGVRGLRAIKEKRGFTMAEDKSTCIVFGMPKSAIEAGVVDRVIPLGQMGNEITSFVMNKS